MDIEEEFVQPLIGGVCVVVQFYPWFKFSFLLFLGMVMYDNNMIMSLKQKKRKFEPRIKLNHNICLKFVFVILLNLSRKSFSLLFGWITLICLESTAHKHSLMMPLEFPRGIIRLKGHMCWFKTSLVGTSRDIFPKSLGK